MDFTEFVAATLHVHQLEEHDSEKWQQRSQAAFDKFDIDKDGYITSEELRMVSILILALIICLQFSQSQPPAAKPDARRKCTCYSRFLIMHFVFFGTWEGMEFRLAVELNHDIKNAHEVSVIFKFSVF